MKRFLVQTEVMFIVVAEDEDAARIAMDASLATHHVAHTEKTFDYHISTIKELYET